MIVTEKQRLDWLDLLKGFAIFLMVMGHFLAWTFPPGVNRGVFPLFVRDFIYSFHMPLFFFVSGFLVDLKKKDWNMSFSASLLSKRVMTLLLPGFSFCFLFWIRTGTLYFEWFLKALFEIYLIFTVVKFSSFALKTPFWVEIFEHFFVIIFIYCCTKFWNGSISDDIVAYQRLFHAYPYFVLGYLYYRCGINRLVLEKEWVYTVSFIVFLVVFFAKYTEFLNGWTNSWLTAISAIVVCCKVAQGVNYLKPNLVVKKMLQWGRITICIYLVSPLFIPWLPNVGQLFIDSDMYEPYNNVFNSFHISTIFLQLISGTIVSIYVCYMCQFVKKVVEKSRLLNFVLFGERR